MKWTVTSPPTDRIVDYAIAKKQCNVSSDIDQDYILWLIDVATDFAQEKLASSLMSQEITATYEAQDVASVGIPSILLGNLAVPSVVGFNSQFPMVRLPRGPVLSVTSVIDAASTAIGHSLFRIGNSDLLCLKASVTFPLTVVYQAGYEAGEVPPMIRHAILTHVATLFENRESVAPGTVTIVPHSLESFYRLRSRNTGIG